MIGPDVCLSRAYSRGVFPSGSAQIPARSGSGRPALTISDPLGGTLMLNPNSSSSGAASLGTRIQVGPPFRSVLFLAVVVNSGAAQTGRVELDVGVRSDARACLGKLRA
jgi:hypothetical protein